MTLAFRLLEKAGENLDSNQFLVLDVFSKYPSQVIERLFSHRGISGMSNLGEVRKALVEHIKDAESFNEIFENLKPFSTFKADRVVGTANKTPQQTSALTTALVETKSKPAGEARRSEEQVLLL